MNPHASTKCAGRLLMALTAIASILLIASCGSSSSLPRPNSEGFGDGNLSGTYVFSFSGTDITDDNESFFAVAGTLVADGNGNIKTGSTIDINDPALGAALGTSNVLTGAAATGSYTVTPDGRGHGTITASASGHNVQFGLDFVLMSGSHGLITRFDGNGTGSGTIDLQASGVTQSSLQGSYAFGFGGVDSGGNSLGTVGAFTLNTSGTVTAGTQDFNDNGNSESLTDLSLISPSTVTIGTAPGTAQLTTSAAGFGTLTFDVWVIDSTHLKFIETDTVAALAGDAFVSTGQTAFPSGTLVFTMLGEDTDGGPLASGGLLTSNGSSITGGLQDVNDEGSPASAPNVTGSFSSSGARTELTLDGIYNGNIENDNLVTGDYTFAAYPYNGGVQLMEIDNAGITGGAAYVQSTTSFAASEGYGLNLTGANDNGEVDGIAQFVATNGESGIYDMNNQGATVFDQSLGGNTSYSASSNGRGTAAFPNLQTNSNSVIGALNLTFYVVNSSTVAFIETDGTQLAIGSFQVQSSSQGQVAVAAQHQFTIARPKRSARAAWRQLNK